MIPLWLTITCSIILLIVIFYNLITSDIDWKLWKRMIKSFAEMAIAIITGICIIIITLAIAQRLPW